MIYKVVGVHSIFHFPDKSAFLQVPKALHIPENKLPNNIIIKIINKIKPMKIVYLYFHFIINYMDKKIIYLL